MSDFDFPESSTVAKDLAARITPRLKEELDSRKETLIANSGNAITRLAVRTGWPVGMRLLPTLTEAGTDALLDEFGSMTLAELAGRIAAHNRAKGHPTHTSLQGRF